MPRMRTTPCNAASTASGAAGPLPLVSGRAAVGSGVQVGKGVGPGGRGEGLGARGEGNAVGGTGVVTTAGVGSGVGVTAGMSVGVATGSGVELGGTGVAVGSGVGLGGTGVGVGDVPSPSVTVSAEAAVRPAASRNWT